MTIWPPIIVDIVYKFAVRNSHRTCFSYKRMAGQCLLHAELIPVYCNNRVEYIDTLCGQDAEVLAVDPGDTYNM